MPSFATVDAILLAGAPNDGPLSEEPAPLEALIDLGGRPIAAYVLDALRASGRVRRVAVMGPREPLSVLADGAPSAGGDGVESSAMELVFAGDGGGLLANIQRGFDSLATPRPVLIVTSDIPLLSPEAVRAFLDACEAQEADVYYPIIPREDSERAFPGVRRTYVKVAEGQFTGGNIALLAPAVLQRHQDVFQRAVEMRKNPIGLARLFGLGLLVKLLLGRLTVADVEDRFRRGFGLKGVAVRCPHPEVGFDVDKPDDLQFVRRLFASRANQGA